MSGFRTTAIQIRWLVIAGAAKQDTWKEVMFVNILCNKIFLLKNGINQIFELLVKNLHHISNQ